MKKNRIISFYIAALGLFLVAAPSWAMNASDASDASALCSGIYHCDGETIAPDNRAPLAIQQPSNPSRVQGLCSTLPAGQDYLARPTGLTCGGGDAYHKRERMAYSQEDLDKNFELLNLGKTFQNRLAAQKVLLREQTWSHDIQIPIQENWTYKRKVGGYVNCSGAFGAEGGEVESYQTTCYRRGRQERVVRAVIKTRRICERANPPPPPPKDDDDDSSSYRPSGSTYGGSSGSKNNYNAPTPKRTYDSGATGRASGEKSTSDRMRRGKNSSNQDFQAKFAERSPAYGLRRIEARKEHSSTPDDNPAYGCAVAMKEIEVSRSDEEVWANAEDPVVQYACVKQRNRWCTWYEDQSASRACPETKKATVEVKFKTPSDWNPNNPKYDDQLPNKFDLLISEAELVKVALNGGPAAFSSSRNIVPDVKIANALKGRTQPWNNYETRWIPRSGLSCEYKDQTITLEVEATGRIVQSAPNPLQLPTDENGVEKPFEGVDSKNRPLTFMLVDPTRSQALDRSNLSRIFGEDPSTSPQGKADVSVDPALKNAGISKKFWENTRFWMRLVWIDDNDNSKRVKVSLGRPFNINQAGAIGNNLNISMTGQMGMPNLYKLSVPFERFFGFLGGDVPLDPNKRYAIEIKVAQEGFDGIYLSGLSGDDSLSAEEKKLVNNDAYSETKLIKLPPHTESSRTFMQKFWDWRACMMHRSMCKSGGEK